MSKTEDKKNKVNYLALNYPVYAPFIGIPGDDFFYLFFGLVVFFPILFIAVLIWTVPGLVFFLLFVLSLYSIIIVLLRSEMKKRPKRGLLYEKITYFLSKDFYSVI